MNDFQAPSPKTKKRHHSIRHSFALLADSYRNCREQFWKSLIILIIITIILATVFYFFESPQQSEYSNWFKNVLWAFCVYIGDPGGLGGTGPVTIIGRIIATLLGIINILIVAVPAGIFAGGFTAALENETLEKKNAENYQKIRNAFKRILCRHTGYRYTPAFMSIVSLEVKLGLSANDIIAAVNCSNEDDLRLRNLADTYSRDNETPDRLVVELFPFAGTTQDGYLMEEKDYGCLINRKSKVTIACTSSYSFDELSDSHFAYYLAQFGGFNYISREFGSEDSFYTVSDETQGTYKFKSFLNDIMSLASDQQNAWTLFILQTPRNLKSQFCFAHDVNSKLKETAKITTSVMPENEPLFLATFEAIKSMIEKGGHPHDNKCYKINESEKEYDTPLKADLDKSFKPVGSRNIGIIVGGGVSTNAFTLHIASKIIVRDRRDIPIAAKMAEILRQHLEPEKDFDQKKCEQVWKLKGLGYNNQDDES